MAQLFKPWWRSLLAAGFGVPLLLGIVLATGAAVSWLSGGYERPDTLDAGRADGFAAQTPQLFEEDDVWLVRLDGENFLALYDYGIESGCPLQWRREFEFMDRTGWFVDACTGTAYDLTGRCFSPPCRGALLDRFSVAVGGGNVAVDLRDLIRDAAQDPDAQPVNPPAE